MDINEAHAAAANLTTRDSTIMRITSMFFTPEHKRAAHAMYAFFRTADNLVDEGHVSLEQFRNWRRQSQLPIEQQTDPAIIAWADIRTRYKLGFAYEEAALDGLELDLTCHRYETMDELKQYCYDVAVAPALLSMSIIGFRPGVTLEQAKPYMENMGMALQLTDMIRDVGQDAGIGRIYLPKSELAAFGLTFADIDARRYDERFKRLMQHFTNITRNYYSACWPILDMFTDSFRLAGGVGLVLNRLLLDEVERRGFDVYPRIKIPVWRRLGLLAAKWPAIYWTKSADRYFQSTHTI
jgi:phytoene synthase